jgi:pimeloyl-ACP methyl ester carboxylesterase
VPGLANALAGWIEAMALAPVALLGNSFGCQIIVDLAARHARLVERAVLQGPTTPPEERSWLWQFVRWRQNQPFNPVGRKSHRQQIETTPPRRPIEQGDRIERIRIEEVREVADGVGKIDQVPLLGPLLVVVGVDDAEGEVGRPAGLDRRHDLVRKLLLGMKDELDTLAGLLLEGRNDLTDRLVLLRGALVPPHDEVGAASAERRQDEHGSKKGRDELLHGRSLRQNLLDARDRLVDRLLGADVLGDDAMPSPRRAHCRPGRAADRPTPDRIGK